MTGATATSGNPPPAAGPGPSRPVSRWQTVRALILRRDDYGISLVLIVATIVSLALAGDGPWGRELAVVLGGGTLLFVLHTSGARHRFVMATLVIVVVAILGTGTVLALLTPRLSIEASMVVGLLLAVCAPLVILAHIVRSRMVTFRLVIGALCIYLLIGLAYAYAFPLMADVAGTPFFTQVSQPVTADYLYFSYTTLTTVGYGDLTAATSAGRMLAISEALMGQLYLVSAVAMLVGNVGRNLPAAVDGAAGAAPDVDTRDSQGPDVV